MMYGFGYGMGIWMIIGWIIMAAVIVFALYGLIILLRRSDPGAIQGKPSGPLEILQERLARGEIGVDEYNRIKEELIK